MVVIWTVVGLIYFVIAVNAARWALDVFVRMSLTGEPDGMDVSQAILVGIFWPVAGVILALSAFLYMDPKYMLTGRKKNG